MWEAIAGIIGLISALASYFIWSKKRRKTARDLLMDIEKRRSERDAMYRKGLKEISAYDYDLKRDIDILLKANSKRDPK